MKLLSANPSHNENQVKSTGRLHLLSSAATMRIVNWNINGLYNTLKDAGHRHSSVSNYFSQVLRADILCFQEAKIQEEKLEKWMACVPGYESFWAFCLVKKGYSGVVTYVKEDFSPLDAKADYLGDLESDADVDLCREGRVMETDHGSFILINVYVPNEGETTEGRPRLNFKLHFLKALKHRCDDIVNSGKEVVVLGDFNIAHKDIDIYNDWRLHDIYTPDEISWIDDFFRDYVDLFRHFHPDARDVFSCWDAKKERRIHNEGVRIDYAACSKGFLSQVIDTEVVKMVPKGWSDHAAVVLTLKGQPVLPVHPIPAISSRNMKRFKEDLRQKKLTALFSARQLKSMPSSPMGQEFSENVGCTSLKKIECTRGKDAEDRDLSKGGNCQILNEELLSGSTKEKGCLDNSEGADPSISSMRFTNNHPTLNLNNENQCHLDRSNNTELVDNAQFDQKHEMGSLFDHILFQTSVLPDANRTIASENENNQLKETKQGVTDDSMASSLDYVESAITGKSSKSLDLKFNSMAEASSNIDIHVSQNTLKQPLTSTQQKSKATKKRRAEGDSLSGQSYKQKGLKSYFRTQNG